MAKEFSLEIITPERAFFHGMVEALTVLLPDGEASIWANHAAMAAPLVVGSIRFRLGDQWREAINSEGFLEVVAGEAHIFVQACEWPEEIDLQRTREALRKAEAKLKQDRGAVEYRHAQASLARAMNRLSRVRRSTRG